MYYLLIYMFAIICTYTTYNDKNVCIVNTVLARNIAHVRSMAHPLILEKVTDIAHPLATAPTPYFLKTFLGNLSVLGVFPQAFTGTRVCRWSYYIATCSLSTL